MNQIFILLNAYKKKNNKLQISTYLITHLTQAILIVILTLPLQLNTTNNIFKYILLVILLLKPANCTFKVLFSKYQILDKKSKDNSIEGAGALIGDMERLLCACFILLQQYSALGLTITAKSIARYDKITKDPKFAEYYLIGTLYSVLYTLVFYLIIFKKII